MALAFISVYTENFTPDSNPLNPTYWTVDPNYPDDTIAAVSGVGEITNLTDMYGTNYYSGTPSLDSDCYISFKLATWENSDPSTNLGASVYLKIDLADDTTYILFGITSKADDVGGITIDFSKSVSGSLTSFYSQDSTINLNDVYTLAVIGNTAYAFRNGVQLSTGDVSDVSGTTNGEFDLAINDSVDDVQMAQVVVGNVSNPTPSSSGNSTTAIEDGPAMIYQLVHT